MRRMSTTPDGKRPRTEAPQLSDQEAGDALADATVRSTRGELDGAASDGSPPPETFSPDTTRTHERDYPGATQRGTPAPGAESFSRLPERPTTNERLLRYEPAQAELGDSFPLSKEATGHESDSHWDMDATQLGDEERTPEPQDAEGREAGQFPTEGVPPSDFRPQTGRNPAVATRAIALDQEEPCETSLAAAYEDFDEHTQAEATVASGHASFYEDDSPLFYDDPDAPLRAGPTACFDPDPTDERELPSPGALFGVEVTSPDGRVPRADPFFLESPFFLEPEGDPADFTEPNARAVSAEVPLADERTQIDVRLSAADDKGEPRNEAEVWSSSDTGASLEAIEALETFATDAALFLPAPAGAHASADDTLNHDTQPSPDEGPRHGPEGERNQALQVVDSLLGLDPSYSALHLAAPQIDELVQRGQLLASQPAQWNEAIAVLCEALSIEPLHATAFASLVELYRQHGEDDPLVELLLDRQQRVSDPDEKLALLKQTAAVYEQAGDNERAEVVLQAAAALAPDDPEVMAHLAELGGIEQIYSGLIVGIEEGNPALHPAEVAAARSQGAGPPPPPAGSTESPSAWLEQQLNRSLELSERIEILEQLAALHLRDDETTESVRRLQEVLALDDRKESAYRKLAGLYRQTAAHRDLAEVLRRHALVAPPPVAVELYRQLAGLELGPLANHEAALATLIKLRNLAPDDVQTLRALGKIYQERAQWPQALDAMQRLGERLGKSQEGVDLLYRQGVILQDQLQDPSGAEARFQQVLALKPSHGESIGRLIGIYRARGDWGKTRLMLLMASQQAPNHEAKLHLLFEAASVSEQYLSDKEEAVSLLRACLQLNPKHGPAAGVLLRLLHERGLLAELPPLIAIVLEQTPSEEVAARQLLLSQLGQSELANGRPEAALGALRQALAYAPDDEQALTAFAAASSATADHLHAHDALRRLYELVAPRGDQRQQHALLKQLAECALALGDRPLAAAYLDKQIKTAPADREALETLATIQREQGDWPALIATQQALVGLGGTAEQQVALLREIGDVERSKLGRLDAAESAYRQGLENLPNERSLWHRLVELYSQSQRWRETIEACGKLAELEETPELKAKYFAAAAAICNRELDDGDEAVRFYNLTLDANPQQLNAFQSIDAILTKRREWKALEQNYGRMIKRLPAESADTGLQTMLWHNLGEVMRSRRRDFESAIAAFEVAQRLDPENDERRKILAELYLSSGANYRQRAIAAHQELLEREPLRLSRYRTLRQLYLETKRYDAAWALCRTLAFMQKATPEEDQFFRRYKSRQPARINTRLGAEAFQRCVLHPQQDAVLSGIFSHLATAIVSLAGRSPSQFGIKRKEAVDPTNEPGRFCELFNYVSAVLGTPPTELFLRPEAASGLQLATTMDLTSVVAGAHVLSDQRPEREVIFLLAKQLAYLHPALFARIALLGDNELRTYLHAAIAIAAPEQPLPGPAVDPKALRKVADQLRKKLRPDQLEQIHRLAQKLPATIDLERWTAGADMSADRLGFLLCDDLEAATRAISAQADGSATPPRERAGAIVQFSTSANYLEVRALLGLAIA